mmetsp:Transcript_69738/g.136886  ORF Transcript_69738/g.136886 Transcript_69738/m.136886 type:complete len:229 (-) Transcript_69738:63-749(-)
MLHNAGPNGTSGQVSQARALSALASPRASARERGSTRQSRLLMRTTMSAPLVLRSGASPTQIAGRFSGGTERDRATTSCGAHSARCKGTGPHDPSRASMTTSCVITRLAMYNLTRTPVASAANLLMSSTSNKYSAFSMRSNNGFSCNCLNLRFSNSSFSAATTSAKCCVPPCVMANGGCRGSITLAGRSKTSKQAWSKAFKSASSCGTPKKVHGPEIEQTCVHSTMKA